jgi:hypothetical protein
MTESAIPTPLDPADCSPQERARAVATILVAGLLRLSRPATGATSPPPNTSENLSESSPNCLAVSAEQSVTVSAG